MINIVNIKKMRNIIIILLLFFAAAFAAFAAYPKKVYLHEYDITGMPGTKTILREVVHQSDSLFKVKEAQFRSVKNKPIYYVYFYNRTEHGYSVYISMPTTYGIIYSVSYKGYYSFDEKTFIIEYKELFPGLVRKANKKAFTMKVPQDPLDGLCVDGYIFWEFDVVNGKVVPRRHVFGW